MVRERCPCRSPCIGGRRVGAFILLEALVSAAILTMVVLSTIVVAVPVSRHQGRSREMELASVEAQRLLEKIRARPGRRLVDAYPHDVERPLSGLNGGGARVKYVGPAGDPLLVEMTLTWASPGWGTISHTFYTARRE